MRKRRLTLFMSGLAVAAAALLPASPARAIPSFGAFQPIGGVATSAPAVASWGAGRLDVFVRGTDNALWHRWSESGQWSAWESLGGDLRSAPGAVASSNGHMEVAVRGTDDAVWHRWYSDGVWSAWDSFGGVATSAPALAATSFNHFDLLVKGTDDRLWGRRWTGDRWNPWYQVVSQQFTSAPAASSSTGQAVAVARGTDRAGWVLATDASNMNWLNPVSIGGDLRDDPAIAWRPTSKAVFARGTDDQLWMWHYNDSDAPGWHPLGGVLTAGPAAVWEGPVTLDVVVRGTDNGLWLRSGQEGR
jgi:hypothetical protein